MAPMGSKGGKWVKVSVKVDGDNNSDHGQWDWEGETRNWRNKGGKNRKGFKAQDDGYDGWYEDYWPEWTGKGGGKKGFYHHQYGKNRKSPKAPDDGYDEWDEDYWPEWTGKGGGKKGFYHQYGKNRKSSKAPDDGYDEWDEDYWPEWTGKGGGKKSFHDHLFRKSRKGSKAQHDGRDEWDEDNWPEWTGKVGGKKGFYDDRGKGGFYYDDRGKGGNARGFDDAVDKPGSKPLRIVTPVLELLLMFGTGFMGQFGWQPMPPPARLWTEYKTADGTPYYHNSFTGLTQWEKPPPEDWDRDVLDGKGRSKPRKADSGRRDEGGRIHGGRSGESKEGDKGGDGNRGKGGGRRKPEGTEKPQKSDSGECGPAGCNVFVFHLPDDWKDEDLLEYFGPHGNVVSAKVMTELGTGRSRGFGFVSYENRVSAATAIKKMQGFKILGKRLKVELKKGEQNSMDRDLGDVDGGGEGDGASKAFLDDERLISYLRAMAARKKAQSLKEPEGAVPDDKEAVRSPENDVDGANLGGDDN